MITIIDKEDDVFDLIMATTNKVVNIIRTTYGPSNNKVRIDKVLEKMTVDDGVQVARSLEFENPSENAVLNVIREVAVRTNDREGDGTTSSLIMLQAIMQEVAKLSRRDGRKIENELKAGFEDVKKQLLAQATPIKTKEELRKVARISFDNETIANLIADTWFKLGKDGVITLGKSGTMETIVEMTEGISLNRGFISPYMITNPSRMEAVVEKPYILVTDYRLTEPQDIVPLINKLLEQKILSLVIIADNVEDNALSTLILNKIKGVFNTVVINKPSMELEDIATMTGAKVFSHAKGDKLENAEISDLGRAERFVAHRENSVIVSPKAKKATLAHSINNLKLALTVETDEGERRIIEKRIAQFGNKIAVIKAGAPTEQEERALRYKIEDAVNAVSSAFNGGVVCGAGLSLSRLETSSPLLNAALKSPFKQLCANIGIDASPEQLNKNEAINVVTGDVGQFMKVGVADPVNVLIAGVESAISIASILCTTKSMIVETPKKPKEE